MIPVEENEDVKDIEAVIENIDKEIDTYIASSQFEDSKVDYLIEHTKKITVIDKEHYVIDLDLLAGVILIGKDFLLYVHNTMPQHNVSSLTWSVRQGLKTALRLILRRPAVRRSAIRRIMERETSCDRCRFR